MNDHLLFMMGVFDDDTYTPKQARPIRCREEELLPPLPKVRRCSRCHTDPPQAGQELCLLCTRDSREKRKTPASSEDARFMRLRAKMICNGGIVAENKAIAKTLGEFVDVGNARWATRRDLHRLGLPDDGPRVAILIGWPR